MCVRFAATSTDKELVSMFDAKYTVGIEVPPSYNVAPTHSVRVILEQNFREAPDPQRHLRTARWGLLPASLNDQMLTSNLNNARSETVMKEPSFRSSIAKRRAIIPADGYYEWTKSEEGQNVPYFIRGEGKVIAMAGLYELWPDPQLPEGDLNKWVWTCAVITRPAPTAIEHIHDSSPLILPKSFWDNWLSPNVTDNGEIQAIIDSVPEPHLEPHEVSTAIDSPTNNDPNLVKPVTS